MSWLRTVWKITEYCNKFLIWKFEMTRPVDCLMTILLTKLRPVSLIKKKSYQFTNPEKILGPYKSALIAALRLLLRPGHRNGYCGANLVLIDRRNRKSRNTKNYSIFFYCAFSIAAAAAASQSGCRSTPNWAPKQSFCAATEASLYNPKNLTLGTSGSKTCRNFLKSIFGK